MATGGARRFPDAPAPSPAVHTAATGGPKHAHPSPTVSSLSRGLSHFWQQEQHTVSHAFANQLAADRSLVRSLTHPHGFLARFSKR